MEYLEPFRSIPGGNAGPITDARLGLDRVIKSSWGPGTSDRSTVVRSPLVSPDVHTRLPGRRCRPRPWRLQ